LATSTLAEVVQVAGTRWTIETGFAQTKGEVGLDQYQVRTWTAWYRHITLALLAYAYLVVLRAQNASGTTETALLSVPEMRRALTVLEGQDAEKQHYLRWLHWRCRHQCGARQAHERRRQACSPAPAAQEPVAAVLPGIGSVTEESWQQIAPLLPRYQRHPNQRILTPRQALEAMVWVMQHGVAWRAVPETLAAWHTLYTRYQQWVKAGIWQQVVQILNGNTPDMDLGKVPL
jgi:transposase